MLKRRTRCCYGATYEFYGWDHDALMRGKLKTVLLYRGKTRRKPSIRKAEHLSGSRDCAPKVWGDLMTEFRVTWQRKSASDWWLATRENVGIAWKRPQHNYIMNKLNDARTPPWTAARQRAIRDSMGGTAAIVARIKEAQRRNNETGWYIRGNTVSWYGPGAERFTDAYVPIGPAAGCARVRPSWVASEDSTASRKADSARYQTSQTAAAGDQMGHGRTSHGRVHHTISDRGAVK